MVQSELAAARLKGRQREPGSFVAGFIRLIGACWMAPFCFVAVCLFEIEPLVLVAAAAAVVVVWADLHNVAQV